MQQGFVPCKNDKPKNAEISPFKAGSDYSLSANQKRCKEIEFLYTSKMIQNGQTELQTPSQRDL